MAFDYKKEFHRYRHYYQRLDPIIQKPEAIAYTMIILSFISISFFGFFAIRPTVKTIVSLTREIEDNTFVNEQLDKKISALITAQESYQSIQSDLPLIYASIPKSPEFPVLLRQLEDLASEYNASISALQFESLPLSPVLLEEAATQPSAIAALEAEPFSFSMSLESDYPRIMQFIEKLIRTSRMIIIKQVGIKAGRNNLLQLNLQLSSFYLP